MQYSGDLLKVKKQNQLWKPKEGRHYFVSGTSASNLKRYQEVIYECLSQDRLQIYTYGDGLNTMGVAPRGNPNKIRLELEGVKMSC